MPKQRKTTPKKRLTRVSVRAERRPEVDWDKFAWALLQHARIVAAQEKPNASHSKRTRRPKP
jgi:hypothetical protein